MPDAIKALRTPDDRFADIPDFNYPVSYSEDLPGYEGLRAAWVDDGPKTSDRTYLCLHGEPSWSFLYRRMIPVFLASGARVVCPDFFGFGRSDKPTGLDDYSFDFHRDYILRLVEHLNLPTLPWWCRTGADRSRRRRWRNSAISKRRGRQEGGQIPSRPAGATQWRY